MITKEQRLVFSSKGYDTVIERNGRIFAIKSDSINSWSTKRCEQFSDATGLLYFVDIIGDCIFYAPEQYKLDDYNHLHYIGDSKTPEQPINCKNYFQMFKGSKCESLDLSHWDVSEVSYLTEMFSGCTDLRSLDMCGWGTRNVYLMRVMFLGCANLQSIDVSAWDVSVCGDFSSMFAGCSSLRHLDLSSWKVDDSCIMWYMFAGSGIEKVNNMKSEQLEKILMQGKWSSMII